MQSSSLTLKLDGSAIVVEAVALSREAFAPFGDVVENPQPDLHPSSAATQPAQPANAVTANQGSAIKYQHVSRTVDLYDQAPSGRPAALAMSMFVCAARASLPDPGASPADDPAPLPSAFRVSVLERHPYTTQTFIPLAAAAGPSRRYLVIVAPTLPPGAGSPSLPCPTSLPPGQNYPRPLPGSGLPDLGRLRAFVATPRQAVTYGAGTWHAPMVALGPAGTALDFVVVQYANGVAVEDCQEVYFEAQSPQRAGDGPGPAGQAEEGGVVVRLRPLGIEGTGAEKAKM